MSFKEFLDERVSLTKQAFRDLKKLKMFKGVVDDLDQYGKRLRWSIETTLSLKGDILTYQLKMSSGSKVESKQVHFIEQDGHIYAWYDKVPSLKTDIVKGKLITNASEIENDIKWFQQQLAKSDEPSDLFYKTFGEYF